MKKTIKVLLASLTMMLFAVCASAQMTTSSLNGKVADTKGEVIPGAAVVAVHTPSGTQYYAITNEEGLFSINGMRSGGPYSVKVSCLGYANVEYSDVTLVLAEAFKLNAVLPDDAEMLSEAIVISQAASKFSTEKTGAATNISNKQIAAVPTINREITDIAKLSPYGGNGMSFAGADGRTANFTVDGANFNNNFGLSENLPGGGSPISIDAIEEVQVVISPYDVRQSNFIGGGVNAITKSGTNTYKASAYVYHRNENMRGNTIDGDELSGARDKDRSTTYGATVGGPIIKNKLFFFGNIEMSKVPTVVNRWRPSEDGVADADNYISRTTVADMQKVSDYLKTKYGYDTGSYTDYPADESNFKILARLDWNITDKHHLALRYNYTLNRGWSATNGSSSNCGQRAVQSRLSQYSMAFANSLYSTDNKVNTWSVDLNSHLTNDLSNQFLFTYSKLDDIRATNSSKFPFIDILDGTGTFTPYMSVGYELFSWNNGVHNTAITLKDDVTWVKGNHKFVFGASYDYQMADNSYMRNGTGYYRYNSLDDFLNGATPETVALTYGYDGELNPAARVRYSKVSAYAQDEWEVSDNFKLTAGLRLESIIFNNADLITNDAIKELDYNGTHIDTGSWPTTTVQFSPRVGFVWDVLGDKSLKVRGGTGLFTGRIPLVFFTNMPTNSAMVQNVTSITTKYKDGVATTVDPLLSSFSGDIITNVEDLLAKMNSLDPDRFPLTISSDKGVKPSSVQAVDPNFKMPQVWKTSLAVDYAFPTSFPLSVTGEFIFNKKVNDVCMTDINMKSTDDFDRLSGADNRHIYPTNYTYTSTSAYLLTNTNKGYGYTGSIQINARPCTGLNIMAAYTHTVSKEVSGMPGSDASSAFTYIPTTEGPNNAGLHNSQYVEPDRAFLNVTYDDKANNHYSFFLNAYRGGYNYSYMYANDLNGDNYNYDLIYIPSASEINDESKIRFASADDRDRFWAYVQNDPYLSKHEGGYAEAYSVYSPWVATLDFRFAHDFKVKVGKSTNVLQLNVDFNNILNMFNSSWGVMKYMNPDLNSGRILKVDSIASDGVPVFSTPAAVSGDTQTWTYYHAIGQVWSAQVGIKYMFN